MPYKYNLLHNKNLDYYKKPNVENIITVSSNNGNFSTLKDALDSITDNSDVNRYVISLGPGIYSENNPIQGKSYVSITSVGGPQTVRIVAENPDEDLFIMTNLFDINNVSMGGVTASDKYVANFSTAGVATITNCGFGESANYVMLNNANGTFIIDNCTTLNIAVTTIRGFYAQAGSLLLNKIRVSGGIITTLVEGRGSSTIVSIDTLGSLVPTLDTCVYLTDSCRASVQSLRLLNSNNCIIIEDGVDLRLLNGTFINTRNNAITINNIGSNIELLLQSVAITNTSGYDLNILNESTIVYGNVNLSIDKINIIPNAKTYLSITDLKEDDEGINILGELHIGRPEIGAEAVIGEGDSYTRGMIVYTEDTSNIFTDVTSIAASASGSTFTFPGVDVNNSIYIASTLNNGSDFLEHYGLKIKTIDAAVKGTGSIIIEYWNGSTWTNVNGMEVQSGGNYYPYANDYMNTSGNSHIRYNNQLITDTWSKNDPMSLGTEYYWIRFRINSAITTSPSIEQIKLHTNRYEINSDGWVEYFGKARPIGQLPFAVGQDKALEGNLGNQTLYINQNIGAGLNENNFTLTTQIIGRYFFVPYDLDTSCPIILRIAGRPNGTGTVGFTIRWDNVTGGDLAYTTEPSLIPGSKSIIESRSVTSGEIEIFTFQLDISNVVSRRQLTDPDFICMSIHSTTLTDATFAIMAIEATYTKWCEGGHI